jgi:hypothetical protein
MTDKVWNMVLIALVALAAIGVIAIISFVNMGLMGGTMGGMASCGVGIAGGWLIGGLLIAVIASATVWILRRRPQH